MRNAWRLSVCLLLGLTPLLGSCIVEEEAFSATFTVWCAVVDSGGRPVDGQMVAFQAYKLDYDGYEDTDSSFSNSKTTYSDVGHPGAASFVVGYTLHKKGDSQEQAYFSCSVPVVTPSGPAWLTEDTSMDYGAMVSAGQAIDVQLTVALTP